MKVQAEMKSAPPYLYPSPSLIYTNCFRIAISHITERYHRHRHQVLANPQVGSSCMSPSLYPINHLPPTTHIKRTWFF